MQTPPLDGKLPEPEGQDKAAQSPQPQKAKAQRAGGEEEEWHEYKEFMRDRKLADGLKDHRAGIRNRVLLALMAIGGLAGVMTVTYAEKSNSAFETGHEEAGSGKAEDGHKSAGATVKSATKSHKIETHEEIPKEFLALAEAMMDKGGLSSEHLEKPERAIWTKTIVEQMSRANIPLTRQNLMIVLATIDHESRFHETGVVSAPEKILDRKIEEFKDKHPDVYSLMEGRVAKLRSQALKFINQRRAYNLTHMGKSQFTERDVNLAIDYAMKLYESEVPDVVKKLVPKESLNKYRPRTCGSMQINVQKAIALARAVDKETYDDREMREMLDTKKGGLYYGMLYMKTIISAHGGRYGKDMSENEVRNIFAEYNMGVYTTRNAAIQSNIRAFGKDISVDGDLVLYDEEGGVSGVRSDSEKAIREVLQADGSDLADLEIRCDLLLEKSEDFEDTRTYRQLMKIFKKEGLTKTSVIPSGKTSDSFVKFGTTKLNGTSYAARSYSRYESLRNAMKGFAPGASLKVPKAKHAKSKK